MRYQCCLVGVSDGVVSVLSEEEFLARQSSNPFKLEYLVEHIKNNIYFYFDDKELGSLFLGQVSCKVLFDSAQGIKWLVIDVNVAQQHYKCLEEKKEIPNQSPLVADLTIEQLNGVAGCAKLPVGQLSHSLMQPAASDAVSLFSNGERRHDDGQSKFNDLDGRCGLSRHYPCSF